MKKIIMVLMLMAPMATFAQKFGHVDVNNIMQTLPELSKVNGELEAIGPSLRQAAERMNPGGVMTVITFHSLEDRIVKDTFRDLSAGCTCPPEFPVCVCGKKPLVRLLSKKPVTPDDEELARNPRSRSAKLRCAEKI